VVEVQGPEAADEERRGDGPGVLEQLAVGDDDAAEDGLVVGEGEVNVPPRCLASGARDEAIDQQTDAERDADAGEDEDSTKDEGPEWWFADRVEVFVKFR